LFSKKNFILINNILFKTNEKELTYLSQDIMTLIYDEHFIYLCLCEYKVSKLKSSIEHNCSNCSRNCSGNFSYSNDYTCFRWKYDFEEETNKCLRMYI